MRSGTPGAVVVVLFFVAGQALAEPTLSLSTPLGPTPVAVGQTVRIDVNLSGFSSGQLELLAAGVAFDETVFASPRAIQAGSIVPDATLSFIGESAPGFADGLFEAIDEGAANRISGNGRLFSFEVTATSAGVSEFALDFGDALRFNSNDPFMPIEPELELGPALLITVVPEPGFAGAAAVALGSLMLRRHRRPRVG